MALQVLPISLSYRDAKGFFGKTRFHIAAQDTDATVEADVQTLITGVKNAVTAMTNAAYQGSTAFNLVGPPTLAYGANAEYPAEFMKAVFTFTTDLGTIHRFKIPAPKLAIFDTDGVTVLNDGTQALVVAYVAAMKGISNGSYVSSATALALTHFVGGQYKGGIQTKRHNQFIKSSHLVAGEGE